MKVGEIVLFTFADRDEDRSIAGVRTVPAIVTVVHGPDCVNLRAFQDSSATPRHFTSVPRRASGHQSGFHFEALAQPQKPKPAAKKPSK